MVFNAQYMQNYAACGAGSATPDPGVEGMSTEEWFDPATGERITRVLTSDDDGNITIKYLDKEGNDVSTESSNFQAAAVQRDVEKSEIWGTITDDTNLEYSRARTMFATETFEDGVSQGTNYTFIADGSDANAFANDAGTTLALAPIQLQNGDENLDVTGATAIALGSIPAFATYAEIYIDASNDDTNIRWTQNGSVPADDNGEQEAKGSTIKLDTREAIEGFRALTIDPSGALDPALVASLTVVYYNVSPDQN